mgnify:CR=1 FL=1
MSTPSTEAATPVDQSLVLDDLDEKFRAFQAFRKSDSAATESILDAVGCSPESLGPGATPYDGQTQIEAAEQQLFSLAETGSVNQGFIPFADALHGAVTMAAEARSLKPERVKSSSGSTTVSERPSKLARA